MGEIIRQWLFRKTGVLINLEEQYFGLNFSDGTLLTKLLQSYSIISADVAETIRPTDNHNVKVSNIYRLQKLLKFIGIHCNNTTVEEIALGFDTTALKLIYELFMTLEGNEKSYFITQMKETKSENSSLELSFETDLPYPVTKQCPPVNKINEKLNILEGYQNRYKAIIKKCKNAKVEAREALRNQFIYKDPCATDNTPKHKKQSLKEKEINITKIIMDDFSLKHESNEMELTYENLIQLKETSENSALITASKTKANELLNWIRQRTRREAASQAFRHSMRTLLLTELWDRLLEQYEKVFDEGVLQKLLRQSLYEKQIATKLLLVRHEQKTIAQNRIRRNKLILDRQQTELTLDYLKKNAEKELETYELNIEKKRKLELHRRLYADKLKRKYEKHYSLCHEILDAIVDLSVKSSSYQKCFDYEVPSKLWEEWKLSFIKGLPIFENIENLEIMLNEEYQENLDPSVTIEVERNEVLIDHEFKDYMNLSGLWSLDELNSDLLSYKEELEVLGFVVHRLLATKYPKPVPKKLVALPNAKVAAVVVGMDPDQTLDVLQELLHSRGIVVVTLKTVLDESVRAYHKEILAKRDFDARTLNLYMALNGTPNTQTPTVNENKDKNTPLKSMLEKLNGVANEFEGIDTVKDKATQTPRIVPYDDDTSYPSRKAELGKIIYEILLQGQHIPDNLLVDNLIEFLRENTSDSGWVLINFPSTYQQAAFIEESLTGQKLPQISSQTQTAAESNENIQIINSKPPGEELQLSQSLLLPNPISEPKTEPFRTYFSVYVKLEKTEDDPAKFQILLNSEGSPIENIYREQGVIYSFSYKTFNFDTIQNLAKLVIGERDPPLKSSEELFGKALEDVASKFFPPKKPAKTSKNLRKEESPKTVPQSEDQPQIPTKEKKSSKTKKKKIQFKETDSKGKTKKLKTDKSKKRKHDGKTDTKSSDEISSEKSEDSAITDDEIIQQETEAKPEAITQTPDQKPLELEQPQEAHRFVEPDIPSEFQVVLATVWETAEKVYIETMKQVFFLMRIHRSTIAPYEKFIRDKFAEFIKRPDEKQQVVSKFQLQFNEVDEELREFAEMKSELHCRVWELESLLTNACDTRKQESEAERRRVAGQSWVPGELAVLGGAYAAGAQAEVDRAIDTLQLAADYYLAALGKPPPLPRLDRVALLPRGSGGESPRNNLTTSDAPSRRPTRSEHSDASSKPSAVTRWLLDELNAAEPPLQSNDAFTAIDAADRILEASAGLVRDLASREKHELGQKMGADKKKKTKKRPKRQEIQSLDDEANKAIFEKRGRVIEEWEEAIASEVNRATFRLKLLRSRARRDLTELLTRMRKMFQDIREQISQRYEREVGAVEALCEVLRAAVEEETPLQQQLVLEQDRFFVRLDALVFPDPPPPAVPRADEPSADAAFRADQLQWLAATFRRMSPSGVMPDRALVYVLEDLLAHGTDGDMPRVLPRRWEALGPRQVAALVAGLFGAATAFVDWRDLVVRALGLRPPRQGELLQCREQFRARDPGLDEAVSWTNFRHVQLWFEEDFPGDSPEMQVRLGRIKELLFSMFEVRAGLTSYTDMLLAFCKDDDPKEGLAKALALAVGQFVRVEDTAEGAVAAVVSVVLGRVQSTAVALETVRAMLLKVIPSGENLTREDSGNVAANDALHDMLAKAIPSEDFGDLAAQDVLQAMLARVIPSDRSCDIAAQDTVDALLARVIPSEIGYAEDLPLDLVAAVLAATLLWGAEIPPVFGDRETTLWEALCDMYRDLGAADDCVAPWDLFRHKFVDQLLASVTKFNIIDVESLLEEVLATREDRAVGGSDVSKQSVQPARGSMR